MEQRRRERVVPQHVIERSNSWMKTHITNQAKWRLKNGEFDGKRTPCDRVLRELDCGSNDNVLRDYCISGIYSYEGQGIFTPISREV